MKKEQQSQQEHHQDAAILSAREKGRLARDPWRRGSQAGDGPIVGGAPKLACETTESERARARVCVC